MDTSQHTLGVNNTFTDSQLLGCVNDVVSRGGSVSIGPDDVLNPQFGFTAKLTVPANTPEGFVDFLGHHGGHQPSGDIVAPNAIEALRDAITRAQPTLWSNMVPQGHHAFVVGARVKVIRVRDGVDKSWIGTLGTVLSVILHERAVRVQVNDGVKVPGGATFYLDELERIG